MSGGQASTKDSSSDVQHGLAGEFAGQKTTGDGVDLGPWCLDLDMWTQPTVGDLICQQC